MYEIYVSNGGEERLLLKTDFQDEFERALHDILYNRVGYYEDAKTDEIWYVSRAKNGKRDYNLVDFLAIAEMSGYIPRT